MAVPARISIVTLGVSDLERSIAFYEGLGWERTSSSVEGEISWFRTADTYLGLFDREALAKDANVPAGDGGSFAGLTLAICVERPEWVEQTIEEAARIGAKVLKPAQKADWGGISGYFADPDGYAWEVAFNPSFPITDDGRIVIR